MASAYKAYVIAKDMHPDIAREKWPYFQDFIENLSTELIGNFRAKREAPIAESSGRITLHDFKHLFEKNKVCRECSLSLASGQRKGVTKFGCVQCNVPVHLECTSKHIMRMSSAVSVLENEV
ncbi:hypothetical protein FSP39_021329 [Pinctada imbricata]|uniref:Phorbol-ester/DAG-type domain-containing protein n=1 Tax=Pinctada imbricata TaxID=66713 RepID=A0AA89C3Q4_PINIB|nr:hypothetical protein FSP39_021329 [Pinctada imbricata]